MLSLIKTYVAYKTVTSLFYMHSTNERDAQNILNLELELFHLKHKVATNQTSITDLFGKKVITKLVLM
jgi:DNA-binding ferritin-like protein (Dps family)